MYATLKKAEPTKLSREKFVNRTGCGVANSSNT
jgi:hypothetical protein